MSDHTFSIVFEIYLIAGIMFLIAAWFNDRLWRIMLALGRIRHPHSKEWRWRLLVLFLLAVFIPLTINNTLNLLSSTPVASQ